SRPDRAADGRAVRTVTAQRRPRRGLRSTHQGGRAAAVRIAKAALGPDDARGRCARRCATIPIATAITARVACIAGGAVILAARDERERHRENCPHGRIVARPRARVETFSTTRFPTRRYMSCGTIIFWGKVRPL